MKRFIVLILLAFGVSFSSMSFASTVANDAKNEIVIEEYTEIGLDVFTFDNPTVAKLHVDPGDCVLISNVYLPTENVTLEQTIYDVVLVSRRNSLTNLIGNNRALDSIYLLRARDGLTKQGDSRS